MPGLKIMCLGGGSFYFPRRILQMLLEKRLAGSEIVLYDINRERAELVAKMGQRLAADVGTSTRVRLAASLEDAVDGTDFVLSSIGGSGATFSRAVSGSYYHSKDIQICAAYGIPQVVGDTGGPAGMMMGLRSVRAHVEICRELEKRAPKAILFNHSNPMAILMRGIHKYTNVNAYGICHGVPIGKMRAASVLELPPDELECRWIGTNHYYWFTSLTHKGVDVLPELRRRMRDQEPPPERVMSWDLSGIYDYTLVYTADDHSVEFYPFLAHGATLHDLPYALAGSASKHAIDTSKPLADPEPPSEEARREFISEFQAQLDQITLPDASELDRQVDHEGIISLVCAIAAGRRELYVVNMANGGSVPNLPPTAEVEIEAVTDSTGLRPVVMGEAPQPLKGMLEKRFAWQELVADAAVKGDRRIAMQALMLDEMAIWPHKARAMLDELLEASRDLLPQFFA